MSEHDKQRELEDLFTQAVYSHQNGDISKSITLYDKILDEVPGSPLVNYNKGLALYELERYAESRIFYENALASAPGEPDILFNLALCLKQLGLFRETAATYKKILRKNPDDIDSLYNLGSLYKDILDDDNAITYYLKVLAINEDHISAINNIAFVYHRKEDFDAAEKYFTRLLQLTPSNQGARHILACLQGETPGTAPKEYVQQVFDNYSERYEKSLCDELSYSVPQQMRAHVDQICTNMSMKFSALDLGCGTGLAAEAFKDICLSIDGIDLSAKMLEIAGTKNLYDNLYVADIYDYIKGCSKRYNLILCADVFTYIGDLTSIFSLLHKTAAEQCVFCFSTEFTNHSMYSLQKSGRYAHSLGYIEKICRDNHWNILDRTSSTIRKEKDNWIEGMLYYVTNFTG